MLYHVILGRHFSAVELLAWAADSAVNVTGN